MIVLDRVPNPLGEREIWGSNPPPSSQNSQLQIVAATWRIETRSDSAFSQITLDLLFFDPRQI